MVEVEPIQGSTTVFVDLIVPESFGVVIVTDPILISEGIYPSLQLPYVEQDSVCSTIIMLAPLITGSIVDVLLEAA